LVIVKHKRRKNYRRTMGHRQDMTRLLITEINDGAGGVEKISADQREKALAKFKKPAPKAPKAQVE
jgi:large subunit ribosomal protein L21